MDRRLLFILLIDCLSVGSTQNFQRSSVEYVPPVQGVEDPSIGSKTNAFGTAYLPLRRAIEKIPSVQDRAEEHIPLRDEVERVLPHVTSHDLELEQNLSEDDSPNSNEILEFDSSSPEYRVVCYMSSIARYRKGAGIFGPENINPDLCTHIVYSFASLQPDNLTIIPADPSVDIDQKFYEKITSKEIKDKSKVLIAIGGWTDSTGDKYSRLVANEGSRQRFVNSVIAFLRRYNFDGLHLDWTYPVCWQARCSSENIADRNNYVKLVKELKKEFDAYDSLLELGIAVSGYKEVIDVGYDISSLSRYVDFMTVISYDYHGAWEPVTGHLSPLYPKRTDEFIFYNTEATLSELVSLGVETNKLVMGVPAHGQSFTLESEQRHNAGDKAVDHGDYGEYTQQPGILAFYEICERIEINKWTVKRAGEDGTEPFAYKHRQWVGFEDEISLDTKANYVKKYGYGGMMLWTIDMDDFNNNCCYGSYPLLRKINQVFQRIPPKRNEERNCARPTTIPFTTVTSTTGSPSEIWTTFSYSTDSTSTYRPTSTTTAYTTKPWWPPSVPTRPKPPKPPNPSVPTVGFNLTSSSSPSSSSSPWWTSSTTNQWWPTSEVTTASTSGSSQWWPSKPTATTWWPMHNNTSVSGGGTWWTSKPTASTWWWSTTSTVSSAKPTSESTVEPQYPTSAECVNGFYYPDEQNCNIYYYCIYGKKKKLQCAPGLLWNVLTNTCDWPRNTKCGQQYATSDYYKPSGSTTTATSQTPIYPTSTPVQGSTVQCFQQGEHYPVPGDCGGFYICDRGHLVRRQCANGLHWNQNTKYCDWNYNFPCNSLAQHHDYRDQDKNTKTGDSCNYGQFVPHSNNCSRYFQCLWGSYRESSCSPGLYWNEHLMNCDWPENVPCANEIDNGQHTTDKTTSTSHWSSTRDTEPTTMRSTWHPWFSKPTTVTSSHPPSSFSTRSTEPTKSTRHPWFTVAGNSTIHHGTTPWWFWTEKPSSAHHTSSSSSVTPSSTSESWEWHPTYTTVTLPTEPPKYPLNGEYKVVCYFTNWAWYRSGNGKYFPEHVDPNLCTHVIYGFAVLDSERLVIKVYDSWADVDNRFYERVVALKKRGLKVLIAIGGWNDSAGDKYSRLVNSASSRQNFVAHILKFLHKYGFDGLDLDWEYPKCWQVNCNRGPSSDKEGFSALVEELRRAFDQHGYLLSAAVSPSKKVIDEGYDVKVLSDTLDWISVMTYDYHGQWDKKTGHVAPIYYIENDDISYFNINYTINYWLEKGADPKKLVMGIPMYGQGFSLADTSNKDLNAPAYGPSEAGDYTRAAGFLAYYEICDKVKRQGWTVVYDEQKRRGPYAYRGNQWVGFDDVATIRQKVQLIKKFRLGGGMIWALDLDDFRNVCGDGNYPLLRTIVEGLSAPYLEYLVEGTSTEGNYISSGKSIGADSKIGTKNKANGTDDAADDAGIKNNEIPAAMYEHQPMSENKPGGNDYFKVVCYFTNWAWYRSGVGKYLIDDIDVNLCTHIIYAFAVLDSNKLLIKPHDTWADIDNNFYERVSSLKKHGIKVLLGLGGWNDSAGNKYSRLVNNKQSRKKFISHVVPFLQRFKFDGLDVDWEYPKCWQVNCNRGPSSDKKAFAEFIIELKKAFQPHNLLLSAAISPNKMIIDEGYDIPVLTENLDFISVMTYDYHGQWDKQTGHVAPMYFHPSDEVKTFNVNFTMHYLVEQGVNPRKLVMGMPMYGQSFTLADARSNALNSKVHGGGEAGENTKARGFLSFYEICNRVLKDGWDIIYDTNGRMGPYAINGNQWVSFDDQEMIKHKSEYILYNNLGGAMIWALDLDDFGNSCKCGKYPLLTTINRVLRNYPGGTSDPCYFSPPITRPQITSTASSIAKHNKTNGNTSSDGIGSTKSAEKVKLKYDNCIRGEVRIHPTDCSKYITCTYDAFGQEQSCPPGLHFNPVYKMCDWPQKAQCTAVEEPSNHTKSESPLRYSQHILADKNLNNSKTENNDYKVVCYLTNWSAYRYNNTMFLHSALRRNLCTHVVYAFTVLHPNHLILKSNDSLKENDNDFFKMINNLKEKHPQVKFILAVGGWYDSIDDKFSRLVNDAKARARFVNNAVIFLKKRNFDGLEIDWEYPKCWQVNCDKGPDSDKDGFSSLVKEISEAFNKQNLLISVAVSPSKDIVHHAYDIAKLALYADWLAVMSYDYHGFWDMKTGHIAPLYKERKDDQSDNFNVDFSVSYWLNNGLPANKLVLGLPFYGQTFELKDQTRTSVGANVIGPGSAAQFTKVSGFASYYEICDLILQEGWTVVKEDGGTYSYINNQWISFNDMHDIRKKGKYIKWKQLAGAAVWSLDLDDFAGICNCGQYPLLSAINYEIRSSQTNITSIDSCKLNR